MKNDSHIFINPTVVLSKIVDEQIFFPTYYQTLGQELRNVHALLAMKHCWNYFEQRGEYENIIPIKDQINVFFRNKEPASFYTNIHDIDDIILAPKNIDEALFILKDEMKNTGKSKEKLFREFNKIDININVARHYYYFHMPIIYDFVLVDDFKNEHNIMKQFNAMNIREPDHMVFELIKMAISFF